MSITPYIPPSTLSSLPSGIWSGVQGLPVLPYLPGQAFIVSKAPLWSTEVIRTASGRERRTSFWPSPLWQFELAYEVVRHRSVSEELPTMWEFFNVAMGQYAPWLFVDPSDNQILASVSTGNHGWQFGAGDGATTTFQLTRPLNSFVEPVYAVYGQTVQVGGTTKTAGSDYTLSPNGKVTFASAPASGAALTWYGYYYFGCRFLQDDLSFAQIVEHLWSGKSLKFTSLRA